MEKVFLIKHNITRNTRIEVQIPPHEALIDTYLKHMYSSKAVVVVGDKSKVPQRVWHRAFDDFDADGNIEIDMSKAKKIFMQQLRHKRNKTLIHLDQEYCKAHDNKNQEKLSKIDVKKQILRDLPSTINVSDAMTIQDLENFWPTEMLGTFGEM